MIYTLTTNPAIDMNFSAYTFEPSLVNRTYDTIYSANGKGINVSLTLDYFNTRSVVLGFFGGFTGKYIVDTLKQKNINVIPVWTEQDTRINIFINNENEEYKFINSGPFINKEQQEELLKELQNSLDCSLLVISGSLPPGIQYDFYDKVLNICKQKNIEVVLDISSEKKLKELLKYNPKLIKPNDEEIKDIFNIKINDEKDAIYTLDYLYKEGTKNILLTLGEKGLYFYNGKKAYYCSSAKIKLLSSACAGDACLATFLSQWLNNEDDENNIKNALKKAAAIGADVASCYGLGNFKNYTRLIEEIVVKEIKIK